MVTLKQVAEHCGVSVETASAVLNTKRAGLFRPEMREKVRNAAEELGYRPNRIARMLRGAENKTLGIIAGYHPGYPNLHVYTLISAIGTEARKAGYSTVFTFSYEEKGVCKEALGDMLDDRVAGLLFLSINGFDPIKEMPPSAPPFIGVCCPGFSNPNQIDVDRAKGMDLIVEKAWMAGHRSVAVIVPSMTSDMVKFNEVEHVLASHGVVLSQERFFVAGNPSEIVHAAQQAMMLEPRPTCLVCFNDHIAVQVVNHLLAKGFQVPKDVSVTGFDGSWVGEMGEVAVTTVQQPYGLIGQKAIEQILARIKDPEKPMEPLLLETNLKEGGSLASPAVGE